MPAIPSPPLLGPGGIRVPALFLGPIRPKAVCLSRIVPIANPLTRH
jgi:hypothetical protein